MANVYYSTSGDARLAATLAREYQLILADRLSIMGHPAVHYAGNAQGSGSSVIKVPLIGFDGYDRMAAVAEDASTTPTSVTLASASITIARQAIERGISDLNECVDSVGLNLQGMIADGVGAYRMRWMEMYANLVDNFTSTVGTSGVDADFDDLVSALFTLIQASVAPPHLGALYPVQWTDILNSARAEAGPVQFRGDMQSVLSANSWAGGRLLDIDIVASTLIPTANAGADSAGGIHGYGALGYADGSPKAFRVGTVIYPAGTTLYTELERSAQGALTRVVHNAFLGMSELQDAKGVSVITDR